MTRAWLPAALLATALVAAPACAHDARLVERLYNPNEVVRVDGRPNVEATIRFADDEHIENVAIGDSTKWQVTPNKRANLLFVKPMTPRAATNMTVVTDRHTYLFDLVASPIPAVQELMWRRYGEYLAALKGEAYRDHVFAYVEREDTPRSLGFQLDRLREAGFGPADGLHKNGPFAAFGAVKGGPEARR